MSLSMRVLISPKIKRVYLQRFLLSKFFHFKEEVDLRDLCCLFENQLWLEKKCQTDNEFLNKFGNSLEELSLILKEFNFKSETSNRAIDRFSIRLKNSLEDFILPKRNYKEAFKLCNGHFSLKDSLPLGIEKERIPPSARIGIGYRDKGSAKDVAFDGSPSWQEVATHRGPIYHKGKTYEELQNSGKPETLSREMLKFIRSIEEGKRN